GPLLPRGQAHRHDGARRPARSSARLQAARGAGGGRLFRGSGPAAAMTRAMRLFILALLAAPAFTYFVYRLARGLGFLEPAVDKQHEYRRTILTALFAFL